MSGGCSELPARVLEVTHGRGGLEGGMIFGGDSSLSREEFCLLWKSQKKTGQRNMGGKMRCPE